ncbi:MAG: tol-pal system-associated acyl-CoA thioesterase [Burkholderiales bacterium PBB1]|nr:MAG: tol-pal system-associated acyl-CoA thioesterase [Burkholderiales bacterium PBB1]
MTDSPDFELTLRIYWEDTDAGGVVFYANYLKFFERARTEWLRALGHGQEQLRLNASAMFVVSDTSMRYRRPARLDDLLRITVKLAEVRRASMTLAQQAWRGDELLTEGTIRIVCVDAGTFQPRSIPTAITAALPQT